MRGGEHPRRTWHSLGRVELALLTTWAGLPLMLTFLYARPGSRLVLPCLLASNGLVGVLVGSEFPLANQAISQLRQGLHGASGLLYACDLAGAFGGAVLVSVVLIPVLGIVQTCVAIAVLKLVSLVGVVIRTRSPLAPPALRP